MQPKQLNRWEKRWLLATILLLLAGIFFYPMDGRNWLAAAGFASFAVFWGRAYWLRRS